MDKDKVFVHVCGQMNTSVLLIAAKEKSGTTDIVPSAERRERRRNCEKRGEKAGEEEL